MKTILIGMESSGKTELVRSLTGKAGESGRFRGTTLACESYRRNGYEFVDSPGILRSLDSVSSREALESLEENTQVLLVLNALFLNEQLQELFPLLKDKQVSIVLTHWDRSASHPQAEETLQELRKVLQVPVSPLDARNLDTDQRQALLDKLAEASELPESIPAFRSLETRSPRKDLFQVPVLGQILSISMLFGPAWIAVSSANAFADSLYDPLDAALSPLLDRFDSWPLWIQSMLAGDYGFFAMFPFLLLYALPTVLIFALFLSLLKSSGLVDRLTVSLESLLRPIGLSGRDVVRVVMGFGCNVPAVINTRACSSCSRGATVHAISFGSACSYQLPATLAVFAAASMPGLAPIFLAWLAVTTLLYVRWTTPKELRDSLNTLQMPANEPLQWPSLRRVWLDCWQNVSQFFVMAIPVFLIICFVAALLQLTGILDLLGSITAPLMALFRLPGEAATSVILGSIRKDGLAIALLDSDWESLKVPLEDPVQILTAVYLAGVLLPCLVTLFTIAKEFNLRYAMRLCLRQILAAAGFSMLLAWGGLVFLA